MSYIFLPDVQHKQGYTMYDAYADFQQAVMPNGLEIYVLTKPGVPFEIVRFAVKTGSFEEPPDMPGIAHFTEHVVCSSNNMSLVELLRFYSDEGAEFSAYTTEFSTVFGFTAALDSVRFSEYFKQMGYMSRNARFEDVVERERGAILSEFGTHFKSDEYIDFFLASRKALFGSTPYRDKVRGLGNKASVSSMRHEDLAEYYRTHYVPSNTVVVCVGGLTLQEVVVRLMDAGFAEDSDIDFAPRLRIAIPEPPTPTILAKDFVYDKRAPTQSSCEFHWLISGSDEMLPVKVWSNIASTLLADKLRGKEHSVVYSAHVQGKDYRDFWHIQADMKNFSVDVEKFVVEASHDCIKAVPQQREMFEQMRRGQLLKFLCKDETLEEVCEKALRSFTHHGRIVTSEESKREMAELSFDDIVAVARQVVNERRLIVLTRT